MGKTQFRFFWKMISYNRKQGSEIIKTHAYIIIIKDMQTSEVYPHPITHFLYKHYHRYSGSINTEKSAVSNIVPFLNFVLEKVNENHILFHNVNGLADLTERHANLYMQYCVEEKINNNKTVEIKENYLSKFYKYLMDEGVLKNKLNFKLVTISMGRDVKKTYKIDFTYKRPDETMLRKRVKRKDIVPQNHSSNEDRHIIRLAYVREILLLAKREAPDIAFAVALQIFGGLRKGEVLNLVRSALKPQNGSKYGEQGLVVVIRDRQKELFSRLDDKSKEQVKNPRDQAVLVDGILCDLYEMHLNYLSKTGTKHKHPNALFYDHQGNPMSADVYDQRFLKLKNIYLGLLMGTKGRYQEYLDFSETKWRSHIGRGIFTNMCLDAGFNAKQTAVLRGDKSTQSMESYFDIVTATYNIRKALSFLTPDNAKDLTDITMPYHKKDWKDVNDFDRNL